jgi:putative inorganic carbon (hco3(-)) transporter
MVKKMVSQYPMIPVKGLILEALFYVQMAGAVIMAVSLSFSFALFNIGAALLMVTFLIQKIRQEEFPLKKTVLDYSLIIFFIIALISMIPSKNLAMSFQGIHKLFRYLLLFIAARNLVRDDKALSILSWALVIGGLIASLDALFQILLGRDPLLGKTLALSFHNLLRTTAGFPNPNNFASYLAMLIPFTYAIGRYDTKYRNYYFGILILMVTAFAFTYARPAALAIAVSAILFVCIRKDFFILAGAVLCFIAAVTLMPPEVRSWFSQVDSWKDFFSDPSRSLHHQTAINMIKAHPLIGVGINTFDINYGQYHEASDTFTRWTAHQAYLQIAAELGIIGLLVFLVVLFTLLKQSWQGFRAATNRPVIQNAILGLSAGMISFLLIAFFESNFWQPRQTNFFWLWAGLLYGTAELAKKLNVKND